MNKLLLIIALTINFTQPVKGQQATFYFEENYKKAKKLLDNGNYSLAMQSFKKGLISGEKNKKQPYALFFLGFSAYNAGEVSYAEESFLQLISEYPQWGKIEAAYLWLSRIGFEKSGPFKGMLYAKKIDSEPYLTNSNTFIKAELAKQETSTIKQVNLAFPTVKIIAESYILALNKLPASSSVKATRDSLIKSHNFNSKDFNNIPKSSYKKNYEIGVMLPLFIDNIESMGIYLEKSLAVDIYEGAKMAAYDTDSTQFTIHAFDTKKRASQITKFLDQGGVRKLDAILGPLYPKPVEKMKAIAKKEKIIFLNPTASNPSIPESSPYSFLSRANAATLARTAADYMKKNTINKNLYIYYGTSKVDSVSAFTYKKRMEEDSFNVISIVKIERRRRQYIYESLTASEKIIDRKKIEEMDSLVVKEMIQLPTIDSLLIQPDSIGHIFIASQDLSISNEAMSAIISRGDSIKLIGVGNWFEKPNANFAIMERVGVMLAITAQEDVSTKAYKSLKKRYIEKYKKYPSQYFFRGYFGMKVITESLKKYGTYFQNGYNKYGNFNHLFDFKRSNSNESVKIVTLINHHIQQIK